jgi:F0F1-type ATP synthase assembly protein I
MKEENEKNEKSWSAVTLAWELGYSIAVPLVGLALVGRFLDKKFDTSPWLLLVGILISILISSFLVYRKTSDILNKM